MDGTTITLVLGGNVPLNEFAETMVRLRQLVTLLAKEVSNLANIEWIIDDLAGGSAEATIRGEADHVEDVQRVVQAYAVIGRSLEQGRAIPYPLAIDSAARKITRVLNGNITSITFQTDTDEATVTSGEPSATGAARLHAYGAIHGRVETLTSRHRLRFTLYDALNDAAVRCYLQPDQAEIMRDAWGQQVTVRGWITRDPISGRALTINPVEQVDIVPDAPSGSYRRARAVAPLGPNEMTASEAIRRLRDA